MKASYIFAIFVLLVSLMAYGESNTEMEQHGESAALSWLSLVDAGNYSSSWQQSAELFQAQVDERGWIRIIEGVRKPLGPLQGRSLVKTQFASTLPGVPDGKYVIAIYKATYSNKASAIETVTTALGNDGGWYVAGYFIK